MARSRRFHSAAIAVLVAIGCAFTAAAQPTWRFHLAFEDGTGARDTLWLVYDTTAQLFYSGGGSRW